MRFVPALVAVVLLSACTIQLAVPEGLVDAAKQAAADGRIVSQAGSLEEKPVVFPSPEPTPPSTPLPVPSELQETPTPEPTPTIDCTTIKTEVEREAETIRRDWAYHSERPEVLVSWGQFATYDEAFAHTERERKAKDLEIEAEVARIYAKFYAKYPTAECIRTPAPEQPAQ